MKKKTILTAFALAASLATAVPFQALAATSENVLTLESCGAYLFEWRPVDCGNGRAFAILVGGNTIYESDVILNPGYDYMYTFDSSYARPWGAVPALVNIDGVWGIPENESVLPEGAQAYTRIVLYTNYKTMSTKERYVDVVYLPGNVNTADLPDNVRKYLINVDGSDAGAYDGTVTAGWIDEEEGTRYRNTDGTYVTGQWIRLDTKYYYLDETGLLLKDGITPDGVYVNSDGERTTYMPGWTEVNGAVRYIQKNGYYAASSWITDTDGSSYYFDMACNMMTDKLTPDGYYVGTDGKWDGNPSIYSTNETQYGPAGAPEETVTGYWIEIEDQWKYCLGEDVYLTDGWAQGADGNWYYLDADGNMLTSTTTPDGYYVDANGVWTDAPVETAEEAVTEEATA